MADSHVKQRKKHQNHYKKTAHGTSAAFFCFFFRLKIHLSSICSFFTTQISLCRSRPYKSPHRTSAGHVLMGLPLIYGSPRRRGESEPSPGGRLPTPRFSSSGQEHNFSLPPGTSCLPRQSMLGFRSCATPPGTSRRGTLYTV